MSENSHPFQRVYIVGTSGSGKTTLARQLSEHYGLLHRQLDELFWLPDWEMRSREEFLQNVNEVLAQEKWILDGNYKSHLPPTIWSHATAVIWMNYPFWLVFWRVLSRTFKRCWTREELFGGNRETFRKGFFSRDSIILWMVTTYFSNRRVYQEEFAKQKREGLTLIELRHPREVSRLFQNEKTDSADPSQNHD